MMVAVTSYAELVIASVRLLLILLSILVCVDIALKTSGVLRKSIIFLMIAFVPSVVYTIGRILNIEAIFASGKFISLFLNSLTTIFLLIGLVIFNKTIENINNLNKKNIKKNHRKVNKGIGIKNIIKKR